MRLTAALRRQHIDFMFKKHWKVQGNRRVEETNVIASLAARGIKVTDPKEYLKKVPQNPRIE